MLYFIASAERILDRFEHWKPNLFFRVGPLSPRGSVTPQAFARNVPERSTFHAGTTARNLARPRPGLYGIPSSSQDTSSLNPGARPSSFFNKISSKFSKRQENFQQSPR